MKNLKLCYNNATIIFFLLFSSFFVSCKHTYTPKPKGYYRIVFPEKKYQTYQSSECPMLFEYPQYSQIIKDSFFLDTVPDNPCWLNIIIPEFNAKIHLSYKEIDKNNTLGKLIEDAHTMTFKHTIKAEYIDEKRISTPNNVHGIYYEVGGDAASSIQFFLTDSTHHYLRGSLYFYNPPNADSLAPVINFVKQDIDHLIKTIRWK